MNSDNQLSRPQSNGAGGNYAMDPWNRGAGGMAMGSYSGGGESPTVNPLKRVHRLLRGRILLAAVLATLGATAGAVAGYKLLKPQYRSDGLVEVRPVIANPMAEKEAVVPLYEKYIQSQARSILTQRVIQAAMESEEWQQTGRGNSPEAVEDFVKALDVQYMDGSFYIRVSFSDPDPTVGPLAVKAVIKSYLAIFKDADTREARDKADFIRNNLDTWDRQRKAKLLDITSIAQDFHNDDLTMPLNSKVQQLAQLETELQQAQLDLASAEAMAGRKAATQPAEKTEQREWSELQIAQVDPTQTMARLMAAREDKRESLAALRAQGFGENHQRVLIAQREVEAAERRAAEYAANFRANNAGMAMAQAAGQGMALQGLSVEQYKARCDQLNRMCEDLRAQTQRLGEANVRIKSARAEVESLNDQIAQGRRLMDQVDAEIKLSMTGRIKAVSFGDTPLTPAIDKRKQAGALGMIFGGAFPVGVLLLIGLMDQRYRYSEDAGTTTSGMNLLGILPNLPDLLTDPKQASIAAHCVHQVRTMLQIRVNTDDSHVFSVTSASPGDGKTSLTLALGLSFAASGSRTLLIDCDLVGSALSRRLRIDTPEGILDAMAANKAMGHVVETDIENLSVLPAGGAGLHHAGSFSPSALRRVVADARKHFDIVLIDTGPILGSVEATAVAAGSDGVVLVVSRGQQRPLVERSVGQLHAVGARLAGVVFNRAEANDFERSVSRFSQRSIRPGDEAANGSAFRRNGAAEAVNGNGHKGGYGPVAGAVATSFKPGNEYDNR